MKRTLQRTLAAEKSKIERRLRDAVTVNADLSPRIRGENEDNIGRGIDIHAAI